MTSESSSNLRRRAAHAGIWMLTGYGAQQLVRLGSNLIMTRLLMPEAFGIMAIVMMIPIGLEMLTDLGVKASIIRSDRGEDQKFLETAWTLQILRGILIWILAVVTAGLLMGLNAIELFRPESVYADSSLPLILVVASLSVCVSGFESVNVALANRKLVFGRLVSLELMSQALAIPIMVVWAIHSPSIWALVAGILCGSLVRTTGSHVILPGPRSWLGWDRTYFTEIFHFGKFLIPASLFGFLANHGDRLILGGLMVGSQFGVYAIAVLWIEAVKSAMQQLIGRVGLPTMSEVRREHADEMANVYYRFRAFLDATALFAFLAFLFFGRTGIDLIYPHAYQGAGELIEVLSISFLFVPYRLLGPILLSFGASQTVAYMAVIRSVTLVLFVPVAYFAFGPVGAAFMVGINQIWGLPVLYGAVGKKMPLSMKREFLPILVGIIIYALWALT